MYKSILKSCGFLVMLFLIGCVENPNVTEAVYLENPNTAKSWVAGLQRQLAVTTNTVNINVAITSDNYFNNYSQYSKVFDQLQIDYFDPDVNALQADIQELREMALYGIDKVLPADPSATAKDEAYLYFCLGYANVLGGELFTGLPTSNKGTVQEPEQLFENALEALQTAISLDPSTENLSAYHLLMARVYYNLGDTDNALMLTQEAMSVPDLLYQVEFDGQNGPSNQMQNATYDALPNRLAPLPRLDFLDPKYFSVGPPQSDQKPVAIVKAEEAYLIAAEAYLAKGNIPESKDQLFNLLALIGQRQTFMVDDSGETRNGGNRDDYPLEPVPMRFSEGDELKEGYVLDRQQGPVKVFGISGTKVSREDIDSSTTEDELLYFIYRMRQEIFISEGRRLVDLGIKYPISQIEQDNNPNVPDEYTQAIIPEYISSDSIDDFEVGPQGEITIIADYNQILVANKTSPYTIPFF